MKKSSVGEQAEKLQQLFLKNRWSLSVAESCTGGRLASALTQVAGCSGYFLGGVVAYSNSAKSELLKVPVATIEKNGAVSLPVAKSMAEGAKRTFQSDWSVSTSGIAGPDGGSEAKPVGLVCFSVTGPNVDWQGHEVFTVDGREAVMNAAVEYALSILWQLVNEKTLPGAIEN